METVRDNAVRVKRFRELKTTLRTNRQRLLVGIDVAQAEHVIPLRPAHTRVVVPTLTIPNTPRGFTQLWARIQQAQRRTGCREVVCGLEPTGTYHQAVATFLEAPGADVVLLSSRVASWNRRTQDGTWDKNDRKDAANCVDLLEQGKVLFYSQPTGPLADLRRLVKVLRRARVELASCKARWRTSLRPALAPMGEPLPNRLRVELPAGLQAWEASGPGRRAPPGLRAPAHDPGDRPHGRRAPRGRDRRPRLGHAVRPAPEARRARHRPGAVRPVRRAAADLQGRPEPPALDGLPGRRGAGPHGRRAAPLRRGEGQAPGRSVRGLQGHGGAGGDAAPPRVGRVAERPTVRPDASGRHPPAAALTRRGRDPSFPGAQAARDPNVAAPPGDREGTPARRSRSPQPGHGRVGPAWQCSGRMAPYDGA